MSVHNFTRPNLPYPNQSLQNDKRFQVLTRALGAPPTDVMLDSEFNAVIDYLNTLDVDIQGISEGILPGSNIPGNANLFPTTDGAGNISWVQIGNANFALNSINGNKLIDESVTAQQIADGTITSAELSPNAVASSNIANNAVTTNKIADLAVTAAKIALSTITTAQIANNARIVGTQLSANANIEGTQLTNNTITATQIADNTITATQIADNTITATQIATSLYNMISPIGTVILFAGTTGVPSGWLECNGQAVSRTTYSTLFANLGLIYGAGDGVTTFGLPDFRGRVPVGIGSDDSTNGNITNATAPTITLGSDGTFGEETHTLTVNELASHNHTINFSPTGTVVPNVPLFTQSGGTATIVTSASTGGDQPHNNTQPSIFTRYYIRAL